MPAAAGAIGRQGDLDGFVEGLRDGPAGVGAVAVAGLAAGRLGVGLGLALGERGGLPHAGPPGFGDPLQQPADPLLEHRDPPVLLGDAAVLLGDAAFQRRVLGFELFVRRPFRSAAHAEIIGRTARGLEGR